MEDATLDSIAGIDVLGADVVIRPGATLPRPQARKEVAQKRLQRISCLPGPLRYRNSVATICMKGLLDYLPLQQPPPLQRLLQLWWATGDHGKRGGD